MGVDWVNQSPDYILEKWDNYIGQKPKVLIYHNKPNYREWVRKWNPSEEEIYKLRTILYFVCKINKKSIRRLQLSELLDHFTSITRIEIEDVNNRIYNNLHELVKQKINFWIDFKENKREYNLLQIL